MREVDGMEEPRKYKVSIDRRGAGSRSFHVNGDEEFTMNGETLKFSEVSRIYIADADGNGGWNKEGLDLKGLFPSKK